MAISFTCDRCGKTTRQPHQLRKPNSMHETYDLCANCKKAFERFMAGEDQVGDYIYKEKQMPCTHHVPCAYDCGPIVYELEKR